MVQQVQQQPIQQPTATVIPQQQVPVTVQPPESQLNGQSGGQVEGPPQPKKRGRKPNAEKMANGKIPVRTQRAPRGLKAELLLPGATVEVDGLEVPGLEYVLDWLIFNVIKPLEMENDLASLLDLGTQAWSRLLAQIYTKSGQSFAMKQQVKGVLEAAKRNPEFSSAASEVLTQLLTQSEQGLKDASPPKEIEASPQEESIPY